MIFFIPLYFNINIVQTEIDDQNVEGNAVVALGERNLNRQLSWKKYLQKKWRMEQQAE